MFKKGFLFLSVAATSLLVTSLGFINNDEVLARDTKIIVELDNDDEQTNKKFLNQLATLTEFNYRINDTFSSVFNGYTLSVNNVYVDYIKDFSTVKDVTIDKEYHFDMSETSNVSVNLKNTDIPTTNASAEEMNVPSSSNKGEGTFIAILDSGFLLTHNAFTNLSSSVDKKVSKDEVATIVTTSGFHGNNEGSGDASKTYYNDKIPYYFDYGGSGSPSTDYDVYSPCSVHGTHVASLAAANGDYKGIAPNAQLALMKVFTESVSSKGVYSTGAYDSVILEALEDCVKLDVDVLNMSLGSDLDECSSRSKSFEVIDTLESKGVVCSISAGNSGKSYFNGYNEYEFNTTGDVETGTLGSYAVSESAAIIASGVLSDEVVSQVTVNGSTFAYRDQVTDHTVSNTDGSTEDITFKTQHEFLDLFETDASQEYVVVPNLGNTADYDGIDVSGKIAVIMRGEISFTLKVQNAIAKGAKGVAIINNSATDAVGYFDFSSYEPTVPVVSIENRFKDLLLNAETKVIEKVDGSHISDFSTDGTTAKLNIGPTITTPGSNIFGAVPGYENSTTGYIDVVSDDSYDYLSGTSMAAPNYAGAVALILSDSTDADKEAYKKTLDMRTMSTANVLTASNGVNESPRRQGAGLIDVSGAINSKVYLTGENEDNTNKAKIELKNNDEIKEGKVALKFKATNEDTTAKKYKATVNVLCPELADYNGTTYASVNEHTLGSFSQDVTIEAGESEISLNSYSLTSEAKEYLKAFENGSYIEGYVTLTPENSSDEELSIPYLGFYGDYESADCVEPFSFEKEENVVYGSDLLNSTVTSAFNSTYAKPNANFGSYWVGTGLAADKVSMSDIISNTKDISKTYNVLNYDATTNTIYAGNNGYTNTMIITQFVNRSVATNTVTITSKDTGNVILTDHMFDSLSGSSEDENYALLKSKLTPDLVLSGYMAHRAYTIIGLKQAKGTKLYPDGEYTIDFKYELIDGTIQTKSYNLVIDSTAPTMGTREIQDDGSVKVRFSGNTLYSVKANNKDMDIQSDTTGQYIIVPKSYITSNNNVLINMKGNAGSNAYALFRYDEIGTSNIMFESTEGTYLNILTNKITVSSSTSKEFANDNVIYDYSITTAKDKDLKFTDNFKLTFRIPNGYDSEYISVYYINGDTKEEITDYTLTDKEITISTSYTSGSIAIVKGSEADLPTISGESSLTVEGTTQLTLMENGVAVTSGVSWTSSDTSIATVNETGLVTGVSNGKATISATYNDKVYTFEITINNKDSGMSTGAIVAIVCAVVAALIIAGVVVFITMKKKKAK